MNESRPLMVRATPARGQNTSQNTSQASGKLGSTALVPHQRPAISCGLEQLASGINPEAHFFERKRQGLLYF